VGWPTDRRKHVKRARYLRPDDFARARAGGAPPVDALLPDPVITNARQHNTLSRMTDTTGDADGGSLFARDDLLLDPRAAGVGGVDHLSVYARARDAAAADLLLALLDALAEGGFGADAATGRGQFELVGDPEPQPALEAPPPGADALVVLSTFQPAAGDPTNGLWETFTKFGKLGPDFGLGNDAVPKNPLVLLRPGACFRTADPARPFLGRAVPADELLPPAVADALRARGADVVHAAFGLAVPARFPEGLP